MSNENIQQNQEQKKKCPFCGELIDSSVQKCKHCGEWLNKPQKDFKTTALLCFFLGWLGVHRFYTGYIGIGIAQILTFGGFCGIWPTIDMYSIAFGNYKDSNNKPLKEYNKIMAIILSLIITIVLVFNIHNFFDGWNNTETSPNKSTSQQQDSTKQIKTAKQDLEVLDHSPCTGDFGSRMICGTIINNTNSTKSYVQIEINLYDASGNLIDSTLDNINNLEPNGKWKFKAPIMDDNVTNYKIKDVTGF